MVRQVHNFPRGLRSLLHHVYNSKNNSWSPQKETHTNAAAKHLELSLLPWIYVCDWFAHKERIYRWTLASLYRSAYACPDLRQFTQKLADGAKSITPGSVHQAQRQMGPRTSATKHIVSQVSFRQHCHKAHCQPYFIHIGDLLCCKFGFSKYQCSRSLHCFPTFVLDQLRPTLYMLCLAPN